MLELYGTGISLFARKVRLVLNYKGIDYDHIPIFPGNDDIKNHSQLGKIPYIVDGDFSISDSSVIIQYLERKYPQSAILPESPEDFAKALWFEEYSDSKMTQVISAGIFFEKIVKPQMGRSTDEEKVFQSLSEVPTIFDYLESTLTGRHFLVGEKFSIADISVFTNLINYNMAGHEIDINAWPRLAAYFVRLTKLPVISNLIKQEEEEQAVMAV
jgi:glutathione S-transferase